ncbi:MAG: formylglycine-generating enzyme family protein, partial [Pirellulaceae bacterium]|nr:formylglycine-generating enzyme family protein [Pirellulaceae bacterium]
MRQQLVLGVFIALASFVLTPRLASAQEVETKPGKQLVNSIGMKLVRIPAGEFMMGSPKSERDRDDDEQQHRVRLSKSFFIGTTEVTQGQWRTVMKTQPWRGQTYVTGRDIRSTEYLKVGPNFVASFVSWAGATEFCEKLSAKEGRKYRLPTEAQWEYACRSGSTTVYCFGDDASALKDYAWFDPNVRSRTRYEFFAHSGGQKRPNAWGLYDMHGNVREWCADWHGRDYYGKSPGEDPIGPTSGSKR